jgi:GT2 family glycosyltransferase
MTGARSPVTDVVIVCTRRRPDQVAGCLDALVAQTHTPGEIVVVDSSGDGATADVVAGYGERVRYIHTEPALTHQRIVGIAATAGEIVHFVDDDVRLDSQYLATVMAAFAGDGAHAVAGIGGWIEAAQPPRRVRRIDEFFGLDSRLDGVVLRSGRNTPVRARPARPVDVDWLSGAAMSYRRSALERTPPDERYPFEGEDVALSSRIRRFGRLVVVPAATAFHLESDENRVAGAQQVAAELLSRHQRVADAGAPLSMRAFWWSVVGQVLVYGVTGVATGSKRRLGIARGTLLGVREIRRAARG